MKKRILTIAGLTVLGLGVLGGATVFAQDSADGQINIVQRIAQKFNLKEADVQSVFDEVHNEHRQQMQAGVEEKLTQAVKDGKITEAQKQAILKKFSEMKSNKPDFEKFKSMTEDERRAEMEKKRSEMEAWAKENGLTLEMFHELMSPRGRHGFGMKMFHMKLPTPAE